MNIFAYEPYSGGGYAGRELPLAPLQRGELMHRALLADLLALPGVRVLTTRDARLPPVLPLAPVQLVWVAQPDAWHFDDGVQAAEAVWPVAPLAGGQLEALSRAVLRQRRVLLGSQPDVIRLCADKPLLTATLDAAGIPVARCYADGQPLPDHGGAWVIRPAASLGPAGPRPGLIVAGGHASGAARRRAAADASGGAGAADVFFSQPFVAGRPCSVCVLCRDGAVRVLSCNAQRVAVVDHRLYFLGSTVNGVRDERGRYAHVARQIAACLPGLWGYVCVDLIDTADGVVVLDVQPGMSPEWAGVHASTGVNPAALVLALLRGGGADTVRLKTAAVSVDLGMFDRALPG